MCVRCMQLVSALLFLGPAVAGAMTYQVGFGDDCSPGVLVCFSPASLTINAGDSVYFYEYADTSLTGPANVVADDGSFRCANGCDGEGGDGTPAGGPNCSAGRCYSGQQWSFTRVFTLPGLVRYHDEVSGATGVITVQATQTAPQFAIGPGITGAWYDPAQSGHGLFIEVLPNKRLYAAWFTFSPDGSQQAWFSGVGTYAGNTAVLPTVEQPTGGRWIPNFDPSQVVHNVWGTLTFTFTDCNHGRVDFTSPTAYGSGSMNLTRLTEPDGLACQ